MKMRPKPKEKTEQETETNFYVNPAFRDRLFAANKKLDKKDFEKMEAAIPADEKLLFAVVGDLSIRSRYAKSFLGSQISRYMALTRPPFYSFYKTCEEQRHVQKKTKD